MTPAPTPTALAAPREKRALVDAFGRHIDTLRIALTERCNLACEYCAIPGGASGSARRPTLTAEEVVRLARVAGSQGVCNLRLTGGEPLLAHDLPALVARLRALPGIESVALTTNGTLLASCANALADAGLARVNVSLDSLDGAEYVRLTGGGNVADTLAGIAAALDAGLSPVKVNVVVTGSAQQDLLALASLTLDAPLHVRFIERMAIGEGSSPERMRTSEQTRQRLSAAGAAAGLGELLAAGADERACGWGPARTWRFAHAAGTVGFISASTDGSCASCRRLRLTADGFLRPCLLDAREVDVASALRGGADDDALAQLLHEAIAAKPISGSTCGVAGRPMTRIGG